MRRSLVNDYINWMYEFVEDDRRGPCSRLFSHLYDVDFRYSILHDENRFADGVKLRYRFGHENDISQPIIASSLDNRPCSVLEMLIALTLRCEEDIMTDTDIGDRTAYWFWEMLDNLGIGHMNDFKYDEDIVDDAINRFLDREYGPRGEGGLFYVENPKRDMRNVELWYQMSWHLSELI